MSKHKTPSFVIIIIFTTITVFAWIFFDVYRAIKKPAEINVPENLLQPVNPNLNTESFSKVRSGIYYDDSSLVVKRPQLTPTPTEAPETPIPEISLTPTPEEEINISTEEGTLQLIP